MNIFLDTQDQKAGSTRFEPKETKTANYTGTNRRRSHRRSHGDRREELRFELDKVDRRINPGRRVDDKNIKFW